MKDMKGPEKRYFERCDGNDATGETCDFNAHWFCEDCTGYFCEQHKDLHMGEVHPNVYGVNIRLHAGYQESQW